jgi:hypothetical protein
MTHEGKCDDASRRSVIDVVLGATDHSHSRASSHCSTLTPTAADEKRYLPYSRALPLPLRVLMLLDPFSVRPLLLVSRCAPPPHSLDIHCTSTLRMLSRHSDKRSIGLESSHRLISAHTCTRALLCVRAPIIALAHRRCDGDCIASLMHTLLMRPLQCKTTAVMMCIRRQRKYVYIVGRTVACFGSAQPRTFRCHSKAAQVNARYNAEHTHIHVKVVACSGVLRNITILPVISS